MNTTTLLTNSTISHILDFFMNNILIFTAGIGVTTVLIAFISMMIAIKLKNKHAAKECLYFIYAGVFTYIVSSLGQSIIPRLDTTFPEFITGMFTICATAPLAIVALIINKDIKK